MNGRAATTEVFEDLFPAKLHYLLEQAEGDGHGNVIAWQPHGMTFLVKDRDLFVKAFLPNWFRQKKWASFQRQLNHYDFKRITSDRNAYYHPYFVKCDRSLCKFVPRIKVKGMGPRKPNKPEDQPDFYRHPDPIRVVTLSRASRQCTSQPKGAGSTASIVSRSPLLMGRNTSTEDSVGKSTDLGRGLLVPVPALSLASSSLSLWAHPVGVGGPDPLSLLSMMGGPTDGTPVVHYVEPAGLTSHS